jgi:hypothetical protein
MGGLDKANYPNKDEYLRANFGGAMSLQVAHGKLDAYPIPPGQYASNYKAVPLEEMVSKNPKNAAALSEMLGDLRSIAGVCGALKTVPTEMVLASDLGFPVGRLLKIEAPWGGDQTKDAGKEAYLVACEKPYLINLDESGLPVAYIKASDAQQANPLDDPKARVAADWDLAHQMLGDPNARVPREVFLEVCLGKWDFPAGSPDLNYYQEYLNYLFDTATALMLPSQKTDLGKHCFGYATLLAMEFYMGGTPADSLALKADSKPSDRLATVRDELDADWASVPKDVEGRVTYDAFVRYFLSKHASQLAPETQECFEQFLLQDFRSALAMMIPEQKETLGGHCFRYAAMMAGEFYFDAAKEATTGCGCSAPVADILGITHK